MSSNRTSLTSFISAVVVGVLAISVDRLDWAIVFAIAVFLMFTIIFISFNQK